ncbi:hypothetical protein J3R83DRAFT_5578 [Lanmaoa asiatica]|nr:hypothetical protein J3R83DRAFT_5578 [Lanmaoa asiatica]
MFISSTLVTRNLGSATPQACRPFSIHSNVCVGDLIAIVVCSIAGIGFFVWAIHAIRKMRQFPFNYRTEDKGESNEEGQRVDPYHVPSAFDNSLLVRRGVVQTPSFPGRVRTRLALSEPEGGFYKLSTPISSDSDSAQGSMTTPRAPRRPPLAGGQSQRTPTRRSGRHGSFTRGGPHGERYEYGMNDDYIRDVSPSRARGSSVHRSGGGYGSHRSMRRTNGDAMMRAY